ncbi:MAG: DUF4838 domain-containing protein [Lentisphaerae bacterium]|nr:DUF4838 domain-containing protein [Lentisphaerota bacterium]
MFPGEEGEYFTVRPTISMPLGTTLKNPDFTYRDIVKVNMQSGSPIWHTWGWAVRNNMRFTVSSRHQCYKQGLAKYGPISAIGGHCFSPLLNSFALTDEKGTKLTGKAFQAHVARMFAEHPERYPLINGKRVMSSHGGSEPQPCTSNPEVINIVANNVLRFYETSRHPVMLIFGNNDCTTWCQCDHCTAIDPPEEKAAGIVSTRYWMFANAVADVIFHAKPDLIFNGSTYQNFSEPPKGVRPNKHIGLVMLSNHRRCWKHALDDKNCPVNRWYYQYQKDWNDYNVPLYTYEMLSRAGRHFLPVEKNWVDTLRFYKKNFPNFTGMKTEMSCPDGIYSPGRDDYFILNKWRMMWQAMYMGITFQWDVNADYDQVYEEINSLYYGKGWAAGIRDFRTLLTRLYMDAPGCWGYGHSTPVGKFLEVPGAQEILYEYLNAAEKGARDDPDPRALAHVNLEKEYFEKTWVAAYNDYVSNYREVRIFPLMGNIRLDGRLDEEDWKNAETTTRFRPFSGTNAVRYQTGVKLAYDVDNLYAAFECQEPRPKAVKTAITQHDGPIWEDNDVELFINDPMMGGAYIQLLVNAAGVVCDGTVAAGQAGRGLNRSVDTFAEVKTSFAEDRYFVEMRIPSTSITGSRFNPGLVLKINAMRCRIIGDADTVERGESEISTISGGTPHGADSFIPVTFATPRKVMPGSRAEIDTRILSNGSFNEISTEAAKHPKHWNVKDGRFPGYWTLSSAAQYGGDLELLLHPDSTDNYFLRIRRGFIFQEHKAKEDNLRMSLRIRGKGTMAISLLRYSAGWKKSLPVKTIKNFEVDTNEWKREVFEFQRPSEDKSEVHCIMLMPMKDSEIDIDDVILMGIE